MTCCWSLWSNLFFASHSTILSKKQLLGASHRRPGHIAMVRIPKLFQARKKTASICHQMISKHWSNFLWGLSFLNLMPPKKQQAKEGRFQTSGNPSHQHLSKCGPGKRGVKKSAAKVSWPRLNGRINLNRVSWKGVREIQLCGSTLWLWTYCINPSNHGWILYPMCFFVFPLFVGVNFGGQRTKDRSIRLPPSASFHARESCKKPSWWAHFVAWFKVIPTSRFSSTSQGETLDIRMFDDTFFVYEHSRAIYWGSLG